MGSGRHGARGFQHGGVAELASTYALAPVSPMTRTGFTPVHAAGDDLVRQARDVDEVAFADLYRRYAQMVHGLLLARVPFDEVDDLVQEVPPERCSRAWRFRRGLRRSSNGPVGTAIRTTHAGRGIATLLPSRGLSSITSTTAAATSTTPSGHSYKSADAKKLIEDSCKFARDGSMPLPEYVRMHSETRLTPDDVEALCGWARTDPSSLPPLGGRSRM